MLSLTEAHRLAQARLGVDTARQMQAVWPILDPLDDATWEQWLRIVQAIIGNQHAKSSTLASNYLIAFRQTELGPANFVPTLASPVPTEQLATSLTVTGPIRVRALLGAGAKLEKAAEVANQTAARAAMRHAMNGGRDTIVQTVETDRKALGFARCASGKACHFCAMLASRGPVYKTTGTADFKCHDGCSCAVQPVYSQHQEWPAGSRDYQDLWRQSTHGLSGRDAVNAFRQALNA